MRKTISFLAILILCCSVPVLAQDGEQQTITLTIPLAGGFNVGVSTTDVTWPTIFPPVIADDWVDAEQVLDWAFSWRMGSFSTQKLICYSDGLVSSLGGTFVLDLSTHLKQIWISTGEPISTLNGEYPGPAIGVEQELALFPDQRGFGTATLQLQFYNETGAFSAETFTGTITYTLMANT